jgi:uncharacterized phage-associated protein
LASHSLSSIVSVGAATEAVFELWTGRQESRMPTATQIAEWIVRYSHDDLGAPVDPMSLEKLLYYAQCFHLALRGQPLFDDEIRAWQHGPVVKAVYELYRELGAQPIIPTTSECVTIGPECLEDFLSSVVRFFGSYTAIQLSSATHAEDPWIRARRGYARHQRSDEIIPVDELRPYYCTLISDGEEALSQQELLDVVPEPRWAFLYVAGLTARHMRSHPFYQPALAKRFAKAVRPPPKVSDSFYAPIGKPNFVDFDTDPP